MTEARRTLFHGKSSNLCGWCHYHKCGLTVRQMKLKHCRSRQCNAFQMFPEHGYWKRKAFIKAQKAKRKEERRGQV